MYRNVIKLCVLLCTVHLYFSNTSCASSKDENSIKLLSGFHEYGMTNCDQFILKNSFLRSNWSFNISRHINGIDTRIKEVNMELIYGKKGDTVKLSHDYIETPTACFLKSITTVSFPGPCIDHVDQNYWYVSDEMDFSDYTQYKNKYGVVLFAKENQVGNFKSCTLEHHRRDKGPRG